MQNLILTNKKELLSAYYGVYEKTPENFQIVPGHKKLIHNIKDFVVRNPNYFKCNDLKPRPKKLKSDTSFQNAYLDEQLLANEQIWQLLNSFKEN